MMKSSDGGSAGSPEKRLTARSNEPHQALTGVDRPRKGARYSVRTMAARPAASKYVVDLLRVIGGVIEVGVKRDAPRHFLWRRIYLHVAAPSGGGRRAARS